MKIGMSNIGKIRPHYSIFARQSLMDSMAAQKDSDFCVKEEPRMAVEDLVQLFVDRDTLAKYNLDSR